MSLKIDEKSELDNIGKTLTNFRSIRRQRNISIIGNPWVDGIIWARGIPLSLSKLRINITYMPGPMIERILDELYDKYVVNISSEYEREDGLKTIYMNISSKDPIFRNIPKIKSDRKVSLENNSEFIKGYLQANMHSYNGRKDIRIYPVQNSYNDVIKILNIQKIGYVKNPVLIYIKDPVKSTNPIITSFLSFFEEEDEYFKQLDEIREKDEILKESIDITEQKLKKKMEKIEQRRLRDFSNDELIEIMFDQSNKLKKPALEELRYRINSKIYISQTIKKNYFQQCSSQKKCDLSIDRRMETQIIGLLFDWSQLEILEALHNKFIHRKNKDLAYRYVKKLQIKLRSVD